MKIERPAVKQVRLLDKPEGVVVQVLVKGSPAEAPDLALRLQFALSDYFEGKKVDFAGFPLDWPNYTPFQRKVMERARHIPWGQTLTYGALAEQAGFPRAARAVGSVMARNPFPLLVPCHRVVAANGGLGGYSAGLDLKRKLLSLERGGPALVAYLDLRIQGPGWGCLDGDHPGV